MSKSIQIKISGSGQDTDAPTVDDLSEQLSDYFDLLEIIEQTLAEDGQSAIDWRIVHAATASPITFTVEAFARQFAVNVDRRTELVVTKTTAGLQNLALSAERPTYFTDSALLKAERIFERVTNGLNRTIVSTDGQVPDVELTPTIARAAAKNVRTILTPAARPYKEIGSIEGYVQSVSLDGFGRRILQMKSRLTGDDVKCIVAGEAKKSLEHCDIGDVWRKLRISVFGTIHYKGPGRIAQIEASSIKFFKNKSELPSIDDIIDPNFTGGLTSDEYLERLRDGSLS